jgi:hypothetical protein
MAVFYLNLYSNPVETPATFISELKFEQQNKWILEIAFSSTLPFTSERYDSICIESSGGISKLNLDKINNGATLYVIYSDSLASPLHINKTGDIVRVCSYSNGWHVYTDSLCFGSYPNSIISNIPDGYSICSVKGIGFFSLDKSPTVGEPNDTSGTMGTMSGYLYDKNNNLVTQGRFALPEPLKLLDTGFYSADVYSCSNVFYQIYNLFNEYSSKSISIDTIKLNVYPDSLYTVDIHLLGDYIVGVNEELPPSVYEIKVINYPNPFNAATNFVIDVPSSLQKVEKEIIIYNSSGQKIRILDITTSNKAQWDGRNEEGKVVSSGVYYYRLVSGITIYANGSMILLK